jgi:hypothetical protein
MLLGANRVVSTLPGNLASQYCFCPWLPVASAYFRASSCSCFAGRTVVRFSLETWGYRKLGKLVGQGGSFSGSTEYISERVTMCCVSYA